MRVHAAVGDHGTDQVTDAAEIFPVPAAVILVVIRVRADYHLVRVSLGHHAGKHLVHRKASGGCLGCHDIHIGQALGQLDCADGICQLQQVVLAASAAAVQKQNQWPRPRTLRLVQPVAHAVFHDGAEHFLMKQLYLVGAALINLHG